MSKLDTTCRTCGGPDGVTWYSYRDDWQSYGYECRGCEASTKLRDEPLAIPEKASDSLAVHFFMKK